MRFFRFLVRSRRGVAGLGMILVACLATNAAQADVTGKADEKKKKKKNVPKLIPEVRDITATFTAGLPVRIELVASTGTLRPAEFLIRQQPMNGVLSEVRSHPTETNRAIVTYTHRGGDTALGDRFVYACRVDGGPVSAPASVYLVGQRFEPKLQLVDFMGVDKVFTGGEATVRFSLKNAGAADFAADIPWEAPWLGPARIELKAGETGRFLVQFRPERPGIYRLEKILQPGVEGSKLPLYGQCVRPLTVSPGRLLLIAASSGAREGDLQLDNGKQEPVRVQVRATGRLQGGGSFEVPGGGKVRVSLALPPQDVAAFQGEVQVTSDQGGETVLVEAPAKPANLHLIEPASGALDLGMVPVGTEGRGIVRISNTGGATAVIQAQVRAPLSVRPSGEAVRLEPGREAVFVVSVTGDRSGSVASELTFSGSSVAPRIPVRMETIPSDSTAAPVTQLSSPSPGTSTRPPKTPVSAEKDSMPGSAGQRMLMSYLASAGVPVPKDRINPFLERVTSIDLLDRTSHSLTIAWKKPSVQPASWVIEAASMAHVENGSGSFVKIWTPLKNLKFVDRGPDRVVAQIAPLPSNVQLELRIMGVDRDDKVSQPSPGFIITTDEGWKIPGWIWRLLAAGVLGVAAYVLNKMRLGEWEWRIRRRPRPDQGELPLGEAMPVDSRAETR